MTVSRVKVGEFQNPWVLQRALFVLQVGIHRVMQRNAKIVALEPFQQAPDQNYAKTANRRSISKNLARRPATLYMQGMYVLIPPPCDAIEDTL
jgi:hypothetical protein